MSNIKQRPERDRKNRYVNQVHEICKKHYAMYETASQCFKLKIIMNSMSVTVALQTAANFFRHNLRHCDTGMHKLRHQVTFAHIFCVVAPNILGSLDWNFLHVTLLASRILG